MTVRATGADGRGSGNQIPVWAEIAPKRAKASSPAVANLVDDLNDEQHAAVTHGTGPLLVVAGAGTGKTHVITRRVAWLIAEKRAEPEEILALTFTDRAAEEMQGRVDRLVPYGYATTPIKTFHAWGDELLRAHAHRLGLDGDLRVLGRAEVVLLLREHLFELGLSRFLPLGDPTRFLGEIAGFFSRAKDESCGPDEIAAFAGTLHRSAGEARAAAESVSDDREQHALRRHADAVELLAVEHD